MAKGLAWHADWRLALMSQRDIVRMETLLWHIHRGLEQASFTLTDDVSWEVYHPIDRQGLTIKFTLKVKE